MPQPMPSATSTTSATLPASSRQPANEAASSLTEAGRSKREEDVVGAAGGKSGAERVAEQEAERRYEEAIEEEYAKREGGA